LRIYNPPSQEQAFLLLRRITNPLLFASGLQIRMSIKSISAKNNLRKPFPGLRFTDLQASVYSRDQVTNLNRLVRIETAFPKRKKLNAKPESYLIAILYKK
jgi:hypothetical protein